MGWKLEQGVFFGFFPCIAMAPKQESFFFFFFFFFLAVPHGAQDLRFLTRDPAGTPCIESSES